MKVKPALDRDRELRELGVALDSAELLRRSSIPAAAQRRRMSPGCQCFTLRAWARTISIIDSTGLVDITVASSGPRTPIGGSR